MSPPSQYSSNVTAFLPFRQCALCELSHSGAKSIRKSGSKAVPVDHRPTRPRHRTAADKSPLIAQRFTPLRGSSQVSASPRLTRRLLARADACISAQLRTDPAGLCEFAPKRNARSVSRKQIAVDWPPAASGRAAASASAAVQHPVRAPDGPRSVAEAAQAAG
jgi:hypothetical protein